MTERTRASVCLECSVEFLKHRPSAIGKYCSKKCRAKNPGPGQGFQKGHGSLRTPESYAIGAEKVRQYWATHQYVWNGCGFQRGHGGYRTAESYRNSKGGWKWTAEQMTRHVGNRTGAAHPSWRGGKSGEAKRARLSKRWRDWRSRVFERDDWTCRLCGGRGGNLEPHHIRRFADFPSLRFDLANGITLCRDCHAKTKWREETWSGFFDQLLFESATQPNVKGWHRIREEGSCLEQSTLAART